MNFLLRLIVFCCDPLGIGRRLFVRPAAKAAGRLLTAFRTKADEKVGTVKEVGLRLGLVAFAAVLILWAAVFMYVAFYYTYMPAISHTRPAHMQFKTCRESNTPCSFPDAHIALTKKQQLLMVGQAYKVVVQIEMPETPTNLDLGMFMVCAEMRDTDSVLRDQSCRSAMMRYRSPLIRTIATWTLSPLIVVGLKEEYQRVPVEIFSRYLEERHHPITEVYVQIQSRTIQFYGVSLHIVADFSGLRYFMYHWPAMSAIVAISSNLFFLLVVFLLSWYHWSDTAWLRNLQQRYARIANSIHRSANKALLESSGGSFRDDEELLSFLDDEAKSVDDISGADTGEEGVAGKEQAAVQPTTPKRDEQILKQRRPPKTC